MTEKWAVPTLTQAVADWIATGIVSGHWSAGDRLREIEVCEELGVSRAPVREALRSLQEKGLVRLVPRIGAVVNHFSTETVMDVYELRAIIERWIVVESVPVLEGEDLDQLDAILDDMRAARADERLDDFFDLGWRFRTTLYSGSTNAVAFEMVDQLRGRLHSLPQVMRRDPDHVEKTVVAYSAAATAARLGRADEVAGLIEGFLRELGVDACRHYLAADISFPPVLRGTDIL